MLQPDLLPMSQCSVGPPELVPSLLEVIPEEKSKSSSPVAEVSGSYHRMAASALIMDSGQPERLAE